MPVERRGWVIAFEIGSTGNGRNPIFNGRRQPSCGGTSRMTRECQVRICERLGVKFPGPTRPGTRTDGTQRAFTEANLKTVLQGIWTNGGKPDVIMTGAFNKQVFSTFTGRATQIEPTKQKKIIASVDAYESDFGVLKIMPNRSQRSRDCLVLWMEMWAIAYLNGRRMISVPLAKTGDSDRRMMLS